MPDSFFASSKKRKRADAGGGGGGRGRGRGTASAKFGSSKARTGRKLGGAGAGGKRGTSMTGTKDLRSKRNSKANEELNSDKTDDDDDDEAVEDMDLRDSSGDDAASGDEDENEAPAEKRLRLAQLYLDSLKEDLGEGDFDAAEIDKEIIATRLKQDVLEHSGKVHLFVADSFDLSAASPSSLRTRGHRFSVTSAVASESGKYLFTAGKEGSIIKWDLLTGKKLSTTYKQRPPESKGKGKGKGKGRAFYGGADDDVKGHMDEVLALALSSDGKYLASGGKDRRVCVWDAEKFEWIKTFKGPMCHKDTISSLTFRKGTHSLYSASFDRSVKVFDLTPSVLGYVETLFGHQDQILSLDALRRETCVSGGARDKTVRYWKIADETQLVFRGGGRSKIREVLEGGLEADGGSDDGLEEGDLTRTKRRKVGAEGEVLKRKFVEGSIECVAMVDENTFISGGDSGKIALWNTQKKKPIFTYPLAHGVHTTESETEGLIQTPRWITSVSSLRYSDLFASGSYDSHIRLWKIDSNLKSFFPLGSIPLAGVVNSLQFISLPPSSPSSDFLQKSTWIPESSSHTPIPSTLPGSSSSIATKKDQRSTVMLIAGVGKEHKFGRWVNFKESDPSACRPTTSPSPSFKGPKTHAMDDIQEDGVNGVGKEAKGRAYNGAYVVVLPYRG